MEDYTFGSGTLTARPFNGGDLFGKNAGGGEEGLGLIGDPSNQNEIWYTGDPSSAVPFIELDLADLIAKGFSNFAFAMDSSTNTETWAVWGCTASGFTGTCGELVTGSDQSSHAVAQANYLSFFSTSNNGGGLNVLLNSFSGDERKDVGDVPEPTSILLLGSALAGMGWIRRRRAQV